MEETTQAILLEFFNSNDLNFFSTNSDWKFRIEIYDTLVFLGFKEVGNQHADKKILYEFQSDIHLFDISLLVNVFSQTVSIAKRPKPGFAVGSYKGKLNAFKRELEVTLDLEGDTYEYSTKCILDKINFILE